MKRKQASKLKCIKWTYHILFFLRELLSTLIQQIDRCTAPLWANTYLIHCTQQIFVTITETPQNIKTMETSCFRGLFSVVNNPRRKWMYHLHGREKRCVPIVTSTPSYLLFLTAAQLPYRQLQTILLNVIQSNQNIMWAKTIGRKLNESLHLLPTCHSDVNIFQMDFSLSLSLSPPVSLQLTWLYIWAFSPPRPRRERLFLRWVMLFIKLYRNPVACLSGQSISSSSIMISATPACCYLVMFGGFKPAHVSAARAHMVTVASKNKNTHIWVIICYWRTSKYRFLCD